MTLEGDFIAGKGTIAGASIGGQNVESIYLGKTLVWRKEPALIDEIGRMFMTEDGVGSLIIDKSYEEV